MTEQFYYVDDEKIPLKPSTAFMAIQFSPEADEVARMAVAEKTDVIESLEVGEELEPFGIILLPTTEEATEEALTLSAGEVAAEPSVDRTLPVFQMPDGKPDEVMILIPQFRVQFKPGVSEEDVNILNNEHGVEVVVKDDLGPNSYLLRLTSQARQDALVLANLYHESDLTEYAEPDFVYKVRRLSVPVNDPHYPNQWALEKMNIPQAWHISKGMSSIKIAIVDEGVQTSHPDLATKIVTPYDAVDDDNNQEPNQWDGHGTACAGIAAAVTHNAKGVAGVARECKIIPIRIAYSSQSGANWTTNTTWIARGIRKAVDRGADVISNSWGGYVPSTTIRNAFKYAITNGRGGKGCVVISASGNDDRRSILYPAKYPESMACGASNEWDQRKSKTSQDGEDWWGSNYGPEQDFLAPGVHIYTTDITSIGGYDSGEYFSHFNGTSSATPNAAGVAALILSVDSNLNYGEVKDILRQTAKDLGPTGWDEQHGSGRIDAQKALQSMQMRVHLTLSINGNGSVSKVPDQATYLHGDVVQLTAKPVNIYWRFIEWSGDLNGNTNPNSITMNGNKSVTATFEKCPISMVTAGSMLVSHVNFLRMYRDEIVMKSAFRTQFERLLTRYYQFTPYVVRKMNESPLYERFLKYIIAFPFVLGAKVVVLSTRALTNGKSTHPSRGI